VANTLTIRSEPHVFACGRKHVLGIGCCFPNPNHDVQLLFKDMRAQRSATRTQFCIARCFVESCAPLALFFLHLQKYCSSHILTHSLPLWQAKAKELEDERAEAAKATVEAVTHILARRGMKSCNSSDESDSDWDDDDDEDEMDLCDSYGVPPLICHEEKMIMEEVDELMAECEEVGDLISLVDASPVAAPSRASSGDAPPQKQPGLRAPTDNKAPSKTVAGAGSGGSVANDLAADYTQIPRLLDQKCQVLDEDNALRPTTISTGGAWCLKFQKGLLSKPETRTLHLEQQDEEKARAFDLLDALSRSGTLDIQAASLHVILAATHCFDKTLMNTIVQVSFLAYGS
jgi:hypothetical protein